MTSSPLSPGSYDPRVHYSGVHGTRARTRTRRTPRRNRARLAPCVSWEHSSDGLTVIGGGVVTLGEPVTYGVHEVAQTARERQDGAALKMNLDDADRRRKHAVAATERGERCLDAPSSGLIPGNATVLSSRRRDYRTAR